MKVLTVGTVAAFLALGSFAGGYLMGGKSCRLELEKVQAAAAVQEVKNTATREAAGRVTETVKVEYEKGNSGLRRVYGPGRVLPKRGGQAPALPQPAAGTDAGPADVGPSAPGVAPDAEQCGPLRSDAAVTTRQLLFLQDWIEQQAAVSR